MASKKKKRRIKRCFSGIGGQAVLEGIMMKNNDRYSVAVRRSDGTIAVDIESCHDVWSKYKITKVPFIRGVFNFINSLTLGIRSLNYSAEIYGDEDDPKAAGGNADGSEASSQDGTQETNAKKSSSKSKDFTGTITGILAVIIAVGLFMVLPVYITKWVTADIRNDSLVAIIEGGIRLGIFLLYIIVISLLKDIRRVYMYHGAEHKCINCIERGRPLTVRNVARSSRLHKRCGTSFLLFVVVVSIIVFFFIRVDNMALKVLIRIALIPVIAGISYEILRLAGRYDNVIVNVLSAPGMFLQMLTTREPDEDMIEVAICAVEAVFDWRKFQTEVYGYVREPDSLTEEIPVDAVRMAEQMLTAAKQMAEHMNEEPAAIEEPVNEYVAEPIPEPIVETVEAVQDIPAEEYTEAVAEESVSEYVAEPVPEFVEEVAEVPAVEPMMENVETVPDVSTEELTETPAEVVASESALEPASETESESAEAPAAETESEPAEAPAVETESEPAEAPAAETESESAEAPASETESESAEAPAAETESEPAEAPAVETESEPAEAPAVETVSEPAAQPENAPVAEPAKETSNDPVSRKKNRKKKRKR